MRFMPYLFLVEYRSIGRKVLLHDKHWYRWATWRVTHRLIPCRVKRRSMTFLPVFMCFWILSELHAGHAEGRGYSVVVFGVNTLRIAARRWGLRAGLLRDFT